jgi:hypothetical protein
MPRTDPARPPQTGQETKDNDARHGQLPDHHVGREQEYAEPADGPKLARVTVKKTFTGGLAGEVTYQHDESGATFPRLRPA